MPPSITTMELAPLRQVVSINGFTFTITDLARFLGKSAVTLRGWEKQGLITFPREGSDRKMTLAEVSELAGRAHELKRISAKRLRLVNATVTLLEIIEERNGK